jgi:hypothetical protein
MYTTVLNNFCLQIPSTPASPEDIACRFFVSFQLFRLDIQYRSLDQKHSDNLLALRTFDPNIFPFTRTLISCYKKLRHQDVVSDPTWAIAPVVVLCNKLRHCLNMEGMQNYAKIFRFPIIGWRKLLHGACAASLTAAELRHLYSTHPALSGFFVPGIPASSNTACLYGCENFYSPLASKICLPRTGTLSSKGIGHGLYCVVQV